MDDFFGDYVEELGARGLQQDTAMNGEYSHQPRVGEAGMYKAGHCMQGLSACSRAAGAVAFFPVASSLAELTTRP